jgi:KipI family sensor histidine kinase inhibitor
VNAGGRRSRSEERRLRSTQLGDSALLFTAVGARSAELASALAVALQRSGLTALRDVCAAYSTVAVYFDPLHVSAQQIDELARQELAQLPMSADVEASRSFTIPARYDGPDLASVAAAAGLSAEDVVALHTGNDYRVVALGFAPGFAYLGDVAPSLRLPRRERPRARVPAGAIGIADRHTAVYPFETPGGWHLIGSTETVMFDMNRNPAALLRVGDSVRFVEQC